MARRNGETPFPSKVEISLKASARIHYKEDLALVELGARLEKVQELLLEISREQLDTLHKDFKFIVSIEAKPNDSDSDALHVPTKVEAGDSKKAKLLNLLASKCGVTMKEIQDQLGWSLSTSSAYLTYLKKLGYVIERHGKGPQATYHLEL